MQKVNISSNIKNNSYIIPNVTYLAIVIKSLIKQPIENHIIPCIEQPIIHSIKQPITSHIKQPTTKQKYYNKRKSHNKEHNQLKYIIQWTIDYENDKKYMKQKRKSEIIEKKHKRRDIINKILGYDKKKKEDATLKFILLYNNLKNRINNTLDQISIKKEIRHTNLSTQETFYMMCQLEGISTTLSDVANKMSRCKKIIIPTTTFAGKKQKFHYTLVEELNNLLLKYIEEELKIEYDLLAVDGSKISMNKIMVNEGFPLARNKDTCHNKKNIKDLKKDNKKTLSEYKEKITNELLDSKIKLTVKENKIINMQVKIKREELKQTVINMKSEQKLKQQLKQQQKNDIDENDKDSDSDDDDYEIVEDASQGTYCKGLFTGIIDTKTGIPFKTSVSNKLNEIEHLKSMIDGIKKNTILVMDRGYYSYDLIDFLGKRNIYSIIRLKSSYMTVKYLNNNDLDEYIFTSKDKEFIGIDYKVVRYTINNKKYYIGTTKIDLSRDTIKKYYWRRWEIEEFYKKLKHTLKGNFYDVSHIEALKQTINIQQFVTLYTKILSIISIRFKNEIGIKKRKNNNKNKYETQINFTNALHISINDVLYDMICKKDISNDDIIFSLTLIARNITYVVPNRHFVRHAIIFKGKWYFRHN